MKPYFFILIAFLFSSCTTYNGYNPWFDENEEGILYCKVIEYRFSINDETGNGNWSDWKKKSFLLDKEYVNMPSFELDRKNGILKTETNTYTFGKCIMPYMFMQGPSGIGGTLELRYYAKDDENLKCQVGMIQLDDGDKYITIVYKDITYLYKIRINYEKMLYVRLRNCLE